MNDWINTGLLGLAFGLALLSAGLIGFELKEPAAASDCSVSNEPSENYHVSTSFPTTTVLAKTTVKVLPKNESNG